MAKVTPLNTPKLPILKTVSVGSNYTYLWAFTKAIVNGKEILIKGKSSVGKIKDGGQTGLVVWKDEFLDAHPELMAFNTYREEVISGKFSTAIEYKFVFEPKSGVEIENSLQTQQHCQAGATWALDQLLAPSPLLKALNKSFKQDENNFKLLALAYFSLIYQCIDYEQYWQFSSDNRLCFQQSLSAQEIRNILCHISDNQISEFFTHLISYIPRHINLNNKYLNSSVYTNHSASFTYLPASLNHKAAYTYYVLDAYYPNNITLALLDNQCTLNINHQDANNYIQRTLHQLRQIPRSELIKQYTNFARNRDDHALIVIEKQSALAQAFVNYNSINIAENEVCDYIKSLIPDNGDVLGLDLTYERASKLNKVTAYNAMQQGNILASASTLYNDNKEPKTYGAALKKQDHELNLNNTKPRSTFQQERECILITHAKRQAYTKLNFSPYLNHYQHISDNTLMRLMYFYQQKIPFLMRIDHNSLLFTKAIKKYGAQLIAIQNYDRESGLFKLTLALNFNYRKFKLSEIKSNKQKHKPQRLKDTLYLHLILDFALLDNLKWQYESDEALKRRDAGEFKVGDEIYFDSQNSPLGTDGFSYYSKLNEIYDIDFFDDDNDNYIERRNFFNGQNIIRASSFNKINFNQDMINTINDISTILQAKLKPIAQDIALNKAASKAYKINAEQQKNIDENINLPDDPRTRPLVRFNKHTSKLDTKEQSTLAKIRRYYQKLDLLNQKQENNSILNTPTQTQDNSQAVSHHKIKSQELNLDPANYQKLNNALLKLLNFDLKAYGIKVLISNRIDDINEAIEANHYLDIVEKNFDLLSYEVFCEEQQRLNPLLLKLRPAHDQYMRGQNFVLFLASCLELMLQALFYQKDRQYGGMGVRQRLDIKDIHSYLQKLQKITAKSKSDGFYYNNLSMKQRSYLDFLGIAHPDYEALNTLYNNLNPHLNR